MMKELLIMFQKFLFDVDGADAMDMHSSFNNTDLIAMEKRANRFGLDKKSDVLTLDKELQQLYHTLNIINEDDVRHAQFDTIHVRGTEKMNTNDVFEYFFTHTPLFLEWVDENSCKFTIFISLLCTSQYIISLSSHSGHSFVVVFFYVNK